MSFQSNQPCCAMESPGSSIVTAYASRNSLLKQTAATLTLVMSLSFLFTEKGFAAEHIIQMTAVETQDDGFGNKLLAYQMLNHTVDGADILRGNIALAQRFPGQRLF